MIGHRQGVRVARPVHEIGVDHFLTRRRGDSLARQTLGRLMGLGDEGAARIARPAPRRAEHDLSLIHI